MGCQQKAGILHRQIGNHYRPASFLHHPCFSRLFHGRADQCINIIGLPAHSKRQVGPLIAGTQLYLRLVECGGHLHMRLASVIHSLAAVPAQQILECSLCELGYLPLPVLKVGMLSVGQPNIKFTCLAAQTHPTSLPSAKPPSESKTSCNAFDDLAPPARS